LIKSYLFEGTPWYSFFKRKQLSRSPTEKIFKILIYHVLRRLKFKVISDLISREKPTFFVSPNRSRKLNFQDRHPVLSFLKAFIIVVIEPRKRVAVKNDLRKIKWKITCGSKRKECENIEIFSSPSNINETSMCGDGVKFNELITKPALRKQVCCNCDSSETIHEVRRKLIFPVSNQ